MMLKTEVLLEGLLFPEGPRWHNDKLWFSDMQMRKVMTVDINGKADVIIEMPTSPSGLGWLPNGKLFSKTISKVSKIVSVDGTGLERTKASEHYIKRIDAKRPFCKGYHLSIIVGTNSKILSLRIRQKYCHYMKDIRYLTKRLAGVFKKVLENNK